MAWQDAPALNKLEATQLIGKNGAQIWGVDYKGRLYTNYQIRPGGGWDGWMTNSWSEGGYPEAVHELCASQVHGDTRSLLPGRTIRAHASGSSAMTRHW